ncbi:cytochrome b [Rhizobium wenxiniae]|uniref:cytochrome b n=1 Tax=Rhizobium wenxiniae TaxID=1737357 RepID=UPI001C6E0F0C|nr:cytochrome b/b6 domain-containing protein [Rhizobium wenxiniae]MBW9087654.1 cytochrome b [Rhizobium wenxiniae]
MTTGWRDNGLRYGLVTRMFHWSMAAILLWQFSGIVINRLFGRSALTDLLNSTHGELGATILLLAALRALWGFLNLKNRPKHENGLLGAAARIGHICLYILMLFIPAVAFLRAFGSEWGLALFGFEIVPRSTDNIGWMVAPANLLHGVFAWTLLAMIAGHIAMVLIHRFVWKDDVINRMAGKTRELHPAE